MSSIYRQTIEVIKKEFYIEIYKKTSFSALFLYTICSVVLVYQSFQASHSGLNPMAWNAIFWIVFLFSATSAIGKSFMQEPTARQLYLYILVAPEALILGKIIFNTLLSLLLGVVSLSLFILFLGFPAQNQLFFWGLMAMGSASFSASLTLISAISSKAGNNPSLMAALGFPVVLPTLAMLIKTCRNAIDGLEMYASYDEMLVLAALYMIVLAVSYLLFPYIWRG